MACVGGVDAVGVHGTDAACMTGAVCTIAVTVHGTDVACMAGADCTNAVVVGVACVTVMGAVGARP